MNRKSFLKALDLVLNYFSYFKYAPTLRECYIFFPEKLSYKEFLLFFEDLRNKGELKLKGGRVIRKENEKYALETHKKNLVSATLIRRLQLLLWFVKRIPTVWLLAFSGSVSMKNAWESDDVDFFIITAPRTLWLTRLLVLFISSLLGVRRTYNDSSPSKKACFNLWFSLNNVGVPKERQTLYTAHEVLQIEVLKNSHFTHEYFLKNNAWVSTFFPNVKLQNQYSLSKKSLRYTPIVYVLDKWARVIQMYFIAKHHTTEYVTEKQLWFYPDDFSKKFKV